MADQTLPLNVSDEMKSDDERQNCVGVESDEEWCSSSSDSAEKCILLRQPTHCETVCLLSKLHEAKHHVNVTLDMDEMDLTAAERR